MIASAPYAGPGETLREDLARRYDLVSHSITVAAKTFSLLAVRDTNRLVDAIDPAAFAADERLPYWAELWTSAIALAEWCLQTPWEPDTRVLELGCGLGLVGIAAAAAGAHVTMTDYEEDALRFARCNAEANLPAEIVRDHLRFAHLDWRNPPLDTTYDVILGADIVYERRFFLPLLNLFNQLLIPVGRVARPVPGKPDDALAFRLPEFQHIQNSEFSASQLHGLVVLTEPDRTVGREFFRGAGLAGFHLTTHNSVIYRHGRAAGIVRAELRRSVAQRDAEGARKGDSKGDAEGTLRERDSATRRGAAG